MKMDAKTTSSLWVFVEKNNSIFNIFRIFLENFQENKNLSQENIIRQTQFRIRQQPKLKNKIKNGELVSDIEIYLFPPLATRKSYFGICNFSSFTLTTLKKILVIKTNGILCI